MPHLEGALQDRSRAKHHQHDGAEVLPLGELLQDAHQVDAGEEVPPAVARVRGGALHDVAGGVHVLWVSDVSGQAVEPVYCGHLGDLVKCPVYHRAPLL